MGKGVGMKVAARVATGTNIQAAGATKAHGPFKCLECLASVELVSDYWINKSDPELARHVAAFFRLSKGRQNEHAEGCLNTPRGQVEEIVRQSNAVEDSRNPFSKKEFDGTYVFRINIPAEASVKFFEKEASALPHEVDWKTREEKKWSGQWMSKFCRSAVGLAKLWCALESRAAQTELSKIVRIELSGKRVSWKSFFFPPENFREFANLVGKKLRYPVALLLHARRVSKDIHGKLRIDFTAVKDLTETLNTRISIQVYGSDFILSGFQQCAYYIIFGDYQKRKDSPHPKDGPPRVLYKTLP